MKFQNYTSGFTVVIPAHNEAAAIAETLNGLKDSLAAIQAPHEIIVVDDGSSDGTAENASLEGVTVITHPTNGGYGRSLLTGIEAAHYDVIVIVDADGTYPVSDLNALLKVYERGFHMVVGARQGVYYRQSLSKSLLRSVFRFLAEFTCGRKIPDINSGFRVFNRRPVLRWRDSMSTGFSFTTTITLLFMLNNLLVGYMPISYSKRIGKSKVRLVRDGLRSLQIIITTIAQFNPLKLHLLLIVFNIFGNILGIAWLHFFPSSMTAWVAIIAWNTCTLIASISAFALMLLKPAGAHAGSPAHLNDQ